MRRACSNSQSRSGRSQLRSSRYTLQFRRPTHSRVSIGGKHAAQVLHAGRTGGTVRHPPHSSENPEFLSSRRVRVAPARTGMSRPVEPRRISASVISCRVRCRSSWGKFAVKVGGGHATVHEEVAAGDQRPVGAHEQRADGPTSSGVPPRPTGDNSIKRRYPSPRGPVSSSLASGVKIMPGLVRRGASPRRSSGRPTTATSATAGWR